MKVVFVCAGNICWSPMAEALFRQKLRERGTLGVEVSSCGLEARPGTAAHHKLRPVLGETFRYLSDFRSRLISEDIVQRAAILLTMEQRQAKEILSRFPSALGKVSTLKRFAGEEGDVVDYVDDRRGNLQEWLGRCYSDIDRCLNVIADRMGSGGADVTQTSLSRKSFIG